MKKRMLINAIDKEEKRMAIVDSGKLAEFNIQMAVREPIAGNIYKGVVMKVERGLQAAFIDYGGKKNGFLPLHDVSQEYFQQREEGKRPGLKVGQEVLVQVSREEKDRKGAMLTTFISLPGRYLVLMPNRPSVGVSRKIEDEADRRRLKEFTEQISRKDKTGIIVRTAGMNRTKQELSRDYQHLKRLWKTIQKKAEATAAPALIYQESDFGVRSLRDYFTADIQEILVDDVDTFKKMRDYCKIVAARNVKIIKLYKEKNPIFDHHLEAQIGEIYRERVELKSGGYLVINQTEAMIAIDVNSGKGSNKRDVEETAYKTNLEAAEQIARQLRLRDLGGLIVIDFIDMKDRKHNSEVEKAFKKALSVDRSRIQLSRISRFGMIELSRQKKQSTIQEISYVPCPHCKGRGLQPSLEFMALNAFRRIKSEVVKGDFGEIRTTLPKEVSEYLLNRKRAEISSLESAYDAAISIYGNPDMGWDESRFELIRKEDRPTEGKESEAARIAEIAEAESIEMEPAPEAEAAKPGEAKEPRKKSGRKRSRRRRRKPSAAEAGKGAPEEPETGDALPHPELVLYPLALLPDDE
jgi:ribonuclease E